MLTSAKQMTRETTYRSNNVTLSLFCCRYILLHCHPLLSCLSLCSHLILLALDMTLSVRPIIRSKTYCYAKHIFLSNVARNRAAAAAAVKLLVAVTDRVTDRSSREQNIDK